MQINHISMDFRLLTIAFGVFALVSCGGGKTAVEEHEDFVQYVNPRIGSGGHGHVFVGASVPFGMVQLGPVNVSEGWDWCSGYHDTDTSIIGFSHTHLEGTGIGDLLDITVMPVTGKVKYARGTLDDPESGLWSSFRHSSENIHPGYYSVYLDRYGIRAELSATERVGIHRYTFPESSDAGIVFDLENGGNWDRATDVSIEAVGNNAVQGWRRSQGWAHNQIIYFYAEFSEPFDSLEVIDKKLESEGEYPAMEGPLYARACFSTEKDQQIMLKVALSPTGIEGAKANMAAELADFDFEETSKKARRAWNDELGKIKVTTDDADSRAIFYTAFYHAMIHPCLFDDVDGSYMGSDFLNHKGDGIRNYTVYSLWDTYRAEMPLLFLVQPERSADMVGTMVRIAEQNGGKLPVWHLMGNETNCMVGNPGVVVVSDAIVKELAGVDRERAYKTVQSSLDMDERGQDLRKKYGYIPSDLYNESIGNDMEYAIADGAAANAAKAMGDTTSEAVYRERSHSWRNYMDHETGFARGRFADGSWRQDFDPFVSDHRHQDYVEGNAFQYTWLAPQDFEGMVNFYGSEDDLAKALDKLFEAPDTIKGDNTSPDISGLIGQYVHGNEPSHHIIYLYCMAGHPEKAAVRIRQVYDEMYGGGPDGLSGNEDEGQMSAWYVLSSLGFYQPEPASERLWFGAPLFPKAEVKVPGGTLTIVADGLSESNKYIHKVTFNGKTLNQGWISWDEINQGGTLVYEMGSEAARWY
jgi:predicted alpha-1,2-mannosidase